MNSYSPNSSSSSNGILDLTYSDYTTWNPADLTSVYSRNLNNFTWNTGSGLYEKADLPVTSNNQTTTITFWTTGTLGSSEGYTLTLYNVTKGTNQVLSSSLTLNFSYQIYHLDSTLVFDDNDLFYYKLDVPALSTNQTGVYSRLITKLKI